MALKIAKKVAEEAATEQALKKERQRAAKDRGPERVSASRPTRDRGAARQRGHEVRRQRIAVEQVYDLCAMRVITRSLQDCYAVLGIIHNLWRPVPGRIKDFIAMPRPNFYQSLHTSVITEDGTPFEIQIRTEEMHRLAEEGIAAHPEIMVPQVADPEELKRIRTLVDKGRVVYEGAMADLRRQGIATPGRHGQTQFGAPPENVVRKARPFLRHEIADFRPRQFGAEHRTEIGATRMRPSR